MITYFLLLGVVIVTEYVQETSPKMTSNLSTFLLTLSVLGGGRFGPSYTFSLATQKVIKIACSFFLTFNNKVRNLLPNNQGHRPYLGSSMAFFPT